VARQELDAILAAEKEAVQIIERARARAREILGQAEGEASKIISRAEEEARKQAGAIAKATEDSASRVEKDARARAETEIERVKGLARDRLDRAVETVVLRVKKAL